MPTPTSPHPPTLLPIELLESQLEALDLLESLYPLEGEFKLVTPPTKEGVDEVREATQRLVLATLHQSSWMPRADHTDLVQGLPAPPLIPVAKAGDAVEFLINWLDVVREQVGRRWNERLEQMGSGDGETKGVEIDEEVKGALFRVWFVFQSLSTREKRDDIVNWAKDYQLTGFVLAGKPALLCLEGDSTKIDHYMSEIKSVSWSDIPSFQKKVSERHRTPIPSRIFEHMSEITSLIDKGGFRNNRIEMGHVKDYLVGKGLGEVFGLVVAGGSFV
ncbi:BQ2448_2407 [Microbotryum intermedium]|uniref:BQ2448_2407 protein n=1 Tax=Microbotryum intermedium TaxID=269621 RepID=A0A238F8B6_9BASI|nr:BQ2448_2407 [Microbotryum intermedium]